MPSQMQSNASHPGYPLPTHLHEAEQLINTAQQLFYADIGAIFFISSLTGKTPVSPIIAGTVSDESLEILQQTGTSRMIHQALEEQVVIMADLATQPHYRDAFIDAENIQSALSLVIQQEDSQNLLAILCLYYRETHSFTPIEQEQLQVFAAHGAHVLRQAWYTYCQQEIVRLGQQASQEVNTVEDCFKHLRKVLPPLLDISHFFMLATFYPQRSNFDLFLSERGQYRLLPNNELNGGYEWVLQTPDPLIIDHLSAEPDRLPSLFDSIPGTDFRDRESHIFIPLWFNEAPQGLLSIQHPEAHTYRDDDLHLMTLLGDQIASILSNLSLRENISQLNNIGQLLTRHLESDRVLEDIVTHMRATTQADLVLLYPFQQADKQFDPQPLLAGELLEPRIPQPDANRADDLAMLALQYGQPIFADNSTDLYRALCGDQAQNKGTFSKREKIQSTAVIPLYLIGEQVGVLFCNYRRPQHFDRLKQEFIQGLAGYAAIAIKNSRSFQSLADQGYKQLAALQKIDRQISKSLDLDTLLGTILQLAGQNITFDKGVIFLYQARTEELVIRAAVGRDAETNLHQTIPLNEEHGLTRWVFLEKRPIRVGNVQADRRYLKRSESTFSELDAPLLDNTGAVIGVINLESDQENAFSEADEAFLVTLAGQAVLAVKNAQIFAGQARMLKERERLHKISQRIIQALDETEIFDLILEQALEATGAEAGTFMRYNEQFHDLEMAAERGVTADRVGDKHSIKEGITGYVARKKKPLNVGDLSQMPWADIHLPYIPNARSELAVPLLEGDKLIGVLNVESSHIHHFTDENEILLAEFADLAVIAIQTVERYLETEKERLKLFALRTVDRAIIRQVEDSDRTIQTILKEASILTGAEEAGLFLYKNGIQAKVYRARLDIEKGKIRIDQFKISEFQRSREQPGIIAHVAHTRQSYITRSDAQADPYYVDYLGNSNIRSEVAVPLISADNDELVGVLNLESSRLFAFNEDHVALLELFAGQTVIAIQNAQNYEALKMASRRLSLLYQAAQELGGVTINDHIDEVYHIVTRIAGEYGQSHVIIRRFSPVTGDLVVVSSAPWDAKPRFGNINKQENFASAWVARTGKTLIMPDVDNPPAETVGIKSADPRVKSLINAPIQFEGNFYGNLAFTHSKANHFQPDDDDIKLVEGLALQLAITIHRLETVEAYQEAKQRAQEAEVMERFGLQSFELAHRLGNDLGLTTTYVNRIKRRLEARNVADAIITQNLGNIDQDVRRVLDLSLALSEQLRGINESQPEPSIVPVELLIDEATASLTNVPSNIQIQREIAKDLASVRVVPELGRDVLYNLLTNAIEAMPMGGIITIRAYNTRRYVFVEVSDTGVGIAPDKQDKIFGFLYSTKGEGNTGFGLWIARRKALQNGGDLQLKESRSGEGTTFILSFPKA